MCFNFYSLVTPAHSTLLDAIENFEKFSIESIEPINHTLVVLLMTAKNSFKRVLLLARIHRQELSAQDEGGPCKKAKRDSESDEQNKLNDEYANRWSYTVLDSHITACSSAHCFHRLAARDTLDSIVHETCTKYVFFGVRNEKLIFQREIFKKNLVVQDERANNERDDDDDDDDDEYDDEDYGYSYDGNLCILAANCCCGLFLS